MPVDAANRFPSGDQASPPTLFPESSVLTILLVFASHIFTVPSSAPAANSFPSGDQFMLIRLPFSIATVVVLASLLEPSPLFTSHKKTPFSYHSPPAGVVMK